MGRLTRDGVGLAWRDFGGDGLAVVLLHGLAGYAGEWEQTASWLTAHAHIVALDARGHGASERLPSDVSIDAHVADVSFIVEQLGLAPVVLIGQSHGGVVATAVAARAPELVRGLVLADASPVGDESAAGSDSEVGDALASWPVPFASLGAAREFFADRFGSRLAGEAWAAGLERGEDGWRPRFDLDTMVRTVRAAAGRPSMAEWESVRCPTLVVAAGGGMLDYSELAPIVERLPGARMVEIPGAAHDLHLDRPVEWQRAVTEFLGSLERAPT